MVADQYFIYRFKVGKYNADYYKTVPPLEFSVCTRVYVYVQNIERTVHGIYWLFPSPFREFPFNGRNIRSEHVLKEEL